MGQQRTKIDECLIREKAHELWVQRGCPDGVPEDDWHRAEELLREEDEALVAASPAAEPSTESSNDRKQVAAPGSGASRTRKRRTLAR